MSHARYAPVDLDGQVGIVVNVPSEALYELVRLAVHLAGCLYTLNLAMTFGIPFVRKHIVLVFASDMERPNAAHMTTITPIIFPSCSVVAR